MKFLRRYKEHPHNINESNLNNPIKFYFASAKFDYGYGGLNMSFTPILDTTTSIPEPEELPDFSRSVAISIFNEDFHDYTSDLYGNVYIIAINTMTNRYFSISGHPGNIPQEEDLDFMEATGKIEFWGRVNDIKELAECLRDMYEHKDDISYIFYYKLKECKLGKKVIDYAINNGIISQKQMDDLERMSKLVDIGIFNWDI